MSLIKWDKRPPVIKSEEDESIKAIFDELKSTSSRLSKESILDKAKSNDTFSVVLDFVLNPYITTGLSDKKITKKVAVPALEELHSFTEALEFLKNNNTGSDEIIASIQKFIRERTPEMSEFYRSIFTKSIKVGIGATTVNKVYGREFIPQFEVMLADKYFDNTEWVDGKEFTITLKLDGIRCVAIKQDGKVRFFSRQGQEILGLVELQKELESINKESFVLDGELIVDGPGTSADQYKVTTQVVRTDGDKKGVTFYAFDVLKVEEFEKQKCETPYTLRRKTLEEEFKFLNHVTPLPALYSGTDTQRIFDLLELVRKQHKEGVMVNINDAVYDFKRTRNLLKVKVMQDVDLAITGFEEGSGRLEGTLGRINVDYKGNTLGVGGGFSDEQRKWFWENKDNLIGRVISVQYFEETQNSNGVPSLRFPVFKELREEGKEVSYS